MGNYSNVLLETSDNIATLTINRPKALNALNKDTLLDIKAAAQEVAEDENSHVLIITGAGEKAFVAGADISFMSKMTPQQAREFALLGQDVFRTIETMGKPVIAAVNGFALGGGCELAMACDFIICSENSKFGQPEVGLGVIPGFGGSQRLPRIVGSNMAKQLLFTGEIIDANEALRIGLVNSVETADQLMEVVTKKVKKIVSNGQISVRYCKEAVNEGMEADIDRSMTLEANSFGLCFATEDQKEGMKAFLEKRKAQFKGK
ncbi:enoyl-CoA hydratase [Desulfitispora alkaliphila]|uniref:enoyl-CoA hydratase-related protein n=1 Tax=Desulfitispora alkaliphila TaxID=622674 RepID=UPI003D1FD311